METNSIKVSSGKFLIWIADVLKGLAHKKYERNEINSHQSAIIIIEFSCHYTCKFDAKNWYADQGEGGPQ